MYRNLKHDSILYECEKSLERLKRDTIDIYQIHWPDSSTNQEITAHSLNRLYGEGKIRSVGVCNYSVEKIIELRKYLSVPIVSDQEKFNLLYRKALTGNIPYDRKNDLLFLAYSPLAQGLLTNTVGMERIFSENDYRNKSEIMRPEFRKKVSEAFLSVENIRKKYDCSHANLALGWALHAAGEYSCVISGIRNEDQALENSRACDLLLNGNEVETISESFASLIYRGKW